jgi:hypothetical protein
MLNELIERRRMPMRTVRLALCLVGLTTLFPAISNAAEICYSAFVPAANPQWRNACDGEMAGTIGHSWGVTRYAINQPDPSIGGGNISYDVFSGATGVWLSQSNGAPAGSGSNGINLLRVTAYTGAATLKYRAHVSDVGWMNPVDFTGNAVVGQSGHRLEALEVNVHLNGQTDFWQE